MHSIRKRNLALAVCSALASGQASAETFLVTSTADSGPGSLREAISLTRANDEADIVDLSVVSGQTISLTGIQLYFNYDEVTLHGAGATIDGGDNSRIFSTLEVDFTLRDVTITGGSSVVGGAVYHYFGDLTLENVTITGSTSNLVGGAVVILDEGDRFRLHDSVVTGNVGRTAGGLYVAGDGATEILDSTISSNTASGAETRERLAAVADQADPLGTDSMLGSWRGGTGGGFGGGLIAGAEVTLRRSLVADNQAAAQVGGLLVRADRAEIEAVTVSGNVAVGPVGGLGLVSRQDLLIRNSTVSGNRSLESIAGGVYSAASPEAAVRASFVTVTDNRAPAVGGWYAFAEPGGSSELGATIVAGNQAAAVPDLGQSEDAAMTAVHSLLGNPPTLGGFVVDQSTLALLGADPVLELLADNGGIGATHRPIPGSPVIDRIPFGVAGCGVKTDADQRGRARPAGNGCETGAVEFDGAIYDAVAVPALRFPALAVMLLAIALVAGRMTRW